MFESANAIVEIKPSLSESRTSGSHLGGVGSIGWVPSLRLFPSVLKLFESLGSNGIKPYFPNKSLSLYDKSFHASGLSLNKSTILSWFHIGTKSPSKLLVLNPANAKAFHVKSIQLFVTTP